MNPEEITEKLESESEEILDRVFAWIQKWRYLRVIIGAVVIGLFLAGAAHFLLKLIPRRYVLTMTGGEILFYHHYLATLVCKEVAAEGVNVIIKPTTGSFESLKLVSEGKLDMAFIQGGLDKKYPHVVHAATLQPEALHVLVRPGISEVKDLRGKIINLGSQNGGAWVIAKSVLEFSGLIADVDYVEMNRTNERIVNVHQSRLPDVVVVVSCVPSYLADFFVKERGYTLLEIPFPTSLAYRYGWVAEMVIPDYTYNVQPPVPDREIKTIGVRMQLVAHENTPPEAVQKVLEALYGPSIESQTHFKLDEADITSGANFPISPATLSFLDRNNPIFSMEQFEELSNTFGLVMTLLSGLLLFTKWVAGESVEEEDSEAEGNKSGEDGEDADPAPTQTLDDPETDGATKVESEPVRKIVRAAGTRRRRRL